MKLPAIELFGIISYVRLFSFLVQVWVTLFII